DGLLRVGFLEERLRSDIPIPGFDRTVSLLGFADQPFDTRTASVAVFQNQTVTDSDVAALKSLGAPLVFACLPDHYEFWTQGANVPKFQRHLVVKELPRFFAENKDQLSPTAIYRAKCW